MDLATLWFFIVGVLFVGYFVLDGFDFGVGMSLPFLGKNEVSRRQVINTIGPVWDLNETWVIVAGACLFAAFPEWYATLFSGFYLALFLMLVALIGRGVAFEFRSKEEYPQWRSTWDWLIFFGSVIPAVLWGVTVTNLIQGVPIDAKMHFVGSFFDLLSPYTLVGGVAFLFVFIFHGAIYLNLKTEGELRVRSRQAALTSGMVAALSCLALVGLTYAKTDLFKSAAAGGALCGAIATFLAAYGLIRLNRSGWAFLLSGLTILLTTAGFFLGLFPRLIVSSLNPDWSLTIHNAASSPYTLKLMTVAAFILVPVVLVYQAWSYWVFRQRITGKHLEY